MPGVRQWRINTNIYFAAVSGTFQLHSHCLLLHLHHMTPYMYECPSIQLEQPEYSKNAVRTTRIQQVGCVTKKITIRFSMRITRNEKYSHWEYESFEHVQTFVLACQSYTDEKNTVRIDCHCHCHCQNDQE